MPDDSLSRQITVPVLGRITWALFLPKEHHHHTMRNMEPAGFYQRARAATALIRVHQASRIGEETLESFGKGLFRPDSTARPCEPTSPTTTHTTHTTHTHTHIHIHMHTYTHTYTLVPQPARASAPSFSDTRLRLLATRSRWVQATWLAWY
ncbi:hypothetical protein PMIN01_06618 [Paraphaeosphaeria minitans]|uniref:Uncharacterized protein n=1 Tax=Paraphaeosphaeria minitans TaxID=565426 RepID=A0A9P6GH12_9PLEO|nr:hypothetical protein PMIN01_06618 [Paraphaeosphaeria minitans]